MQNVQLNKDECKSVRNLQTLGKWLEGTILGIPTVSGIVHISIRLSENLMIHRASGSDFGCILIVGINVPLVLPISKMLSGLAFNL